MATSTNTRLTKRDRFEALASAVLSASESFTIVKGETTFHVDASDMVDFLNKEIELLAKKNASERKPDAKKIATDNALMAEIADVLSDGEKLAIGEIMKRSGVLHDLSNQKMAYLLGQMEKNGEVVKTVEKRKAYYSKV